MAESRIFGYENWAELNAMVRIVISSIHQGIEQFFVVELE